MTRNDKAKVLITGATGIQGGAAVQALLRAGHPVTAFVRDPSTAAAQALAEQGVTLATGDLDDTASLEAAAAGHDAVFSMQLPSGEPGAESRQAANIATAADRAGVDQIIHTSVSATGWRSQHPGIDDLDPMTHVYWDEKEAAEEAVRQSGVNHWTIFKPAFYMENFVLQQRRDLLFPGLADGELITAMDPQTALALIAADDFGTAVAAAVADPAKFQHAEIDLAGDALTATEIADTLSQATGRDITTVFLSREEQNQRVGAGITDSQIWNDHVGYPARPEDAARYGLATTTFQRWAAKQDWPTPTA